MAIGCGPKVSKFFLFVFNVLFWLSGLLLIIIGAMLLADGSLKNIDNVVSSSTNRNILVLFIVVGVIIFAIGFCGCCGAIQENRCLLGTYIISLVVIILVEVIFGIFAIVNKNAVLREFNGAFNDTVMSKYGVVSNKSSSSAPDPTIMVTVDNLQQLFKCCGVFSYKNWRNSTWYHELPASKKDQIVPVSCCVDKSTSCWLKIDNSTMYMDGCVNKIQQYISSHTPIVIGVTLGIAFFEIFVVICAFCLCRNTDDLRQAV